jgi:hypothetical protein
MIEQIRDGLCGIAELQAIVLGGSQARTPGQTGGKSGTDIFVRGCAA